MMAGMMSHRIALSAVTILVRMASGERIYLDGTEGISRITSVKRKGKMIRIRTEDGRNLWVQSNRQFDCRVELEVSSNGADAHA